MDSHSQYIVNQLKSAGAQSVAGSLLRGHDTLAILRGDQVLLTPDGEKVLRQINARAQVEDAKIKGEAPAQEPVTEPVAKKTKKREAAAPAEAATEAPAIPLGSVAVPINPDDLDALLEAAK